MKRGSNENSVGEILKQIITTHKLQAGIDQVAVAQAWKNTMGNGVQRYTTQISLKGKTLYVQLNSSVLREELSHNSSKIIKVINEALGKELIFELVLR
jgi:predicted nucleic acid-binding Zn ribbon protein